MGKDNLIQIAELQPPVTKWRSFLEEGTILRLSF